MRFIVRKNRGNCDGSKISSTPQPTMRSKREALIELRVVINWSSHTSIRITLLLVSIQHAPCLAIQQQYIPCDQAPHAPVQIAWHEPSLV